MSGDSGYQVSGNAAERYEQFAAAFMLPWAQNLVERAGLSPGERVLDLACGTGFVARSAAAVVGSDGLVVGADLNAMMVAVARSATGLDIREVPAEATGLVSGSFDVVLCQQGLQYFPDPGAVLEESVRLLRSGGRTCHSIWASLDQNPFTMGRVQALEPYLSPEAVTAFRSTNIDSLGGSEGACALLDDAGFVDVTSTIVRLDVDLPPMAEFFPQLISATPWALIYDGLSDSQRQAAIDVMNRAVDPSPDGRSSTAQMTKIVVSGTRP